MHPAIHLHTQLYIYTPTDTHLHNHFYIYPSIHSHRAINVYTPANTHVHTHLYPPTYKHLHTHQYTHINTHPPIHIYTPPIHIYTQPMHFNAYTWIDGTDGHHTCRQTDRQADRQLIMVTHLVCRPVRLSSPWLSCNTNTHLSQPATQEHILITPPFNYTSNPIMYTFHC